MKEDLAIGMLWDMDTEDREVLMHVVPLFQLNV